MATLSPRSPVLEEFQYSDLHDRLNRLWWTFGKIFVVGTYQDGDLTRTTASPTYSERKSRRWREQIAKLRPNHLWSAIIPPLKSCEKTISISNYGFFSSNTGRRRSSIEIDRRPGSLIWDEFHQYGMVGTSILGRFICHKFLVSIELLSREYEANPYPLSY